MIKRIHFNRGEEGEGHGELVIVRAGQGDPRFNNEGLERGAK